MQRIDLEFKITRQTDRQKSASGDQAGKGLIKTPVPTSLNSSNMRPFI